MSLKWQERYEGLGTGKEIRRIWALNALLLKTNEMGIKICD